MVAAPSGLNVAIIRGLGGSALNFGALRLVVVCSAF